MRCRELTKAWLSSSTIQGLPIDVQSALEHMCSDTIPQGLAWMEQHARDSYPRPDNARAASLLALLGSLLEATRAFGHLKVLAAQQAFVVAFAWGLGGDLPSAHRSKFSPFVIGLFEFLELPESLTVFDIVIRPETPELGLQAWETPSVQSAGLQPRADMYVPSPDDDCYHHLLKVRQQLLPSAAMLSCPQHAHHVHHSLSIYM